jgi:PAS domain S-box-containing protein
MTRARRFSGWLGGWSRPSALTGERLSLILVGAFVVCSGVSGSLVLSADGSGLTGQASAAVILLGVGLLIAAAEVARRVHTQRHDAEALRESEQHFRTLVDHVPAAVYSLDLECVVLAWNPAATEMFGWSEAETVGHLLPFSDDAQGELGRVWAGVTAGRSLTGVETDRRCRDGTTIDVSVSASPVFDETGAVVGVIVIENRRRGDRLLASIVSASADAMMSASLDGAISSWNAGAEAVFGYSAVEIIGQLITVLSQDGAGGREFTERVLAGNSVIGAEGVGIRKDGTTFPMAYTGSPLLQADDVVMGFRALLETSPYRRPFRRHSSGGRCTMS